MVALLSLTLVAVSTPAAADPLAGRCIGIKDDTFTTSSEALDDGNGGRCTGAYNYGAANYRWCIGIYDNGECTGVPL